MHAQREPSRQALIRSSWSKQNSSLWIVPSQAKSSGACRPVSTRPNVRPSIPNMTHSHLPEIRPTKFIFSNCLFHLIFILSHGRVSVIFRNSLFQDFSVRSYGTIGEMLPSSSSYELFQLIEISNSQISVVKEKETMLLLCFKFFQFLVYFFRHECVATSWNSEFEPIQDAHTIKYWLINAHTANQIVITRAKINQKCSVRSEKSCPSCSYRHHETWMWTWPRQSS